MPTSVFHTIVHIEDDISNWRENPAIIAGHIRSLGAEEDPVEELDDASWRECKVQYLTDKYADVAIAIVSWSTPDGPAAAKFVYTVRADLRGVEELLEGEKTFIVDARRPGDDNKLTSSLFDSLEAIAPHVSDSAAQVRVFTAYLDVEEEQKEVMRRRRRKLGKLILPVEVIPKTSPSSLHRYILDRLGIGG